MTLYGYARVSTKKQSLQRQIDAIHADFPAAGIVTEEWTGKTMSRDKWGELMQEIKEGDIIVLDSVSRMSRNAAEGVAAYKELYAKGVELVFIKEPAINTAVYRQNLNKRIELEAKSGRESMDRFMQAMVEAMNALLMDLASEQIELAFQQAEKEVTDLSERTKGGLAVARAAGRVGGRPAGKVKESARAKGIKKAIKKWARDFGGPLEDKYAIDKAKCSRGTYYKYKNELLAGE